MKLTLLALIIGFLLGYTVFAINHTPNTGQWRFWVLHGKPNTTSSRTDACGMTEEDRAVLIFSFLENVADAIHFYEFSSIQGQAARWLINEDELFSNLEVFTLHGNDISGDMPQSVCNLTKAGIQGLVLSQLIADCGCKEPKISCPCCNECII